MEEHLSVKRIIADLVALEEIDDLGDSMEMAEELMLSGRSHPHRS